MTAPADWERLRSLFEGALACPAEQRAAYLDVRINGDDVLREQVETLLAAHQAAEGFLDREPASPEAHTSADRLTANPPPPVSRLETGSRLGASRPGRARRFTVSSHWA